MDGKTAINNLIKFLKQGNTPQEAVQKLRNIEMAEKIRCSIIKAKEL